MRVGTTGRRALLLLALLIPGLLIGCGDAATGSSAPGVPSSEPEFVVVSFNQDGAWDVRRDESLILRFSAEVDLNTLRAGSVRVVRRAGAADFPVSMEVDGDTLLLKPPAPFGFDADARYTVQIDGFPSLRAIRNRTGQPLMGDFRAVFGTSRYCGPDLESPTVSGISLGEEPGGYWNLTLTFSEAVSPDSVKAEASVTVVALPDNEVVSGRFIHDRNARVFRFLPERTLEARAIRVLLDRNILDLAGNRLDPGEYAVSILALPEPTTEPSTGEIVEDFTGTLMMDAVGTTALWNHPSAPGALLGRPRTSILDLSGGGDAGGPGIALGGGEVLIRMLVSRDELGPARRITGFVWTPAIGAAVPAEYESLEVRITPVAQERLDRAGLDLGPTVTAVREAPYVVGPDAGASVSVPFEHVFATDAEMDLLVEIRIGPGMHTNILRARYDESGRSEARWAGERELLRPAIGLKSYSLFPVARSRFYDTGTTAPEYFRPVLDPAAMPEGVRFDLSFQGATRLDADGRPPAGDPAAVSEWVTDITLLKGYRYLRFHASFTGAGPNGEAPFLDTLLVPFRALR